MKVKLKPIHEQVIVITGASSGIGLATARMAVRRGARVVLASRNEPELLHICDELNSLSKSGRQQAVAVCADVSDPDQVDSIAETAKQTFGGFDTWVNNAAVSIYGKLHDVPLIEKRRLFDVNFWGVVHGCRSAFRYLKDNGGAIINIGSALSERSIPIQGMYAASKHAVKAYTDALRMECEEEKLPISVTLIKPGSIDTPYIEHARNHMPFEPKNPAPVYAPEVVAEAILACAQAPQRDIFVGGSSKAYSLMEHFAPRWTDKVMEKTMVSAQQTKKPALSRREDALFSAPRREGQARGDYPGHVAGSSLYTSATLHPVRTALMTAAALGAAGAWLVWTRRSPSVAQQTTEAPQTIDPDDFAAPPMEEPRPQLH